MKVIELGENYYYSKDLYKTCPRFNPGTQPNGRLIKKYDSMNIRYTYARLVDDEWIETEGHSKQLDKLFISKEWFDDNFAPPIIEIHGYNGLMEIRGNHNVDECYFEADSVSIEFKLSNLQDIILDIDSDYEQNYHYKYFVCLENVEKKPVKKLFLTYNGILKVLYSSRGKNTGKFTTWACRTLFTAQMGTPEQKANLAGKLLGVDANSLIDVLKTIPDPVSAIYFFVLGTVESLRKKYNIPKSVDGKKLLGKYGRSEALIRRTKEHKRKYGTNIQILVFNIIDPTYVSEAETSLDLFFEKDLVDITIKGNRETELVAIDESSIKNVRAQYSLIGSKYEGKVSKHAELVKDLTNNHLNMMKDLDHSHAMALMVKDQEISAEKNKNALLMKDNEILCKDNALLKKDNELLAQKVSSLTSKIKAKK